MKIGILQTGHLAEPLMAKHGDYPSMFERLLDGNGFSFEAYAVVDCVFPESVFSCDAWLITGSAHGTYEDHAFIAPLEDFVREAYAKEVPIAGICFGHQLMAQALGGKVEKHPGGWGVGHTVYNTENGERSVLAMHQDQVVKKPDEASVIATTDFCENAGLAYKGKAISFQPHPEFSPEFMRDLIRYKAGKGLPVDHAEEAEKLVRDENDSAKIGMQLAEFFKSTLVEKIA